MLDVHKSYEGDKMRERECAMYIVYIHFSSEMKNVNFIRGIARKCTYIIPWNIIFFRLILSHIYECVSVYKYI